MSANHSSRYTSPVRAKRKILRSSLLSPRIEKFEKNIDDIINSPFANRSAKTNDTQFVTKPVWDFDKGISSADCIRSGSKVYEKRNPLANTRLSCYKPKVLLDSRDQPHYKSVDDFLFLNSDNSDKQVFDQSAKETSLQNHSINDLLCDDKVDCAFEKKFLNQSEIVSSKCDRSTFDSRNSFKKPISVHTKSLENILEPKLFALASSPKKQRRELNMSQISEKLKCMSSRTQKLFSKIYSNQDSKLKLNKNDDSTASKIGNHYTISRRMKPKENAEELAKIAKSRRSLSYGNLPQLEEFKKVLVESKENYVEVATGLTINGDQDADSGILVSESGHSSFTNSGISRCANKDDSDFEFKFVNLCIEENDRDRCLGFSLRPIHKENLGRADGYQVCSIIPGGTANQ